MYNLTVEDLLSKVSAALAEYTDKKLAFGVSGGRDSMCLLHAAVNGGVVNKDNIIVVHVNHGLRDEADSDETLVREYCAAIGVRFRAYRVDVMREAAEKSLTIEQAARDLRYGIFYGLIKSRVADAVLTAHHALDNAESVLMHLFRGAGLDGVCGMKTHGGKVVRPMLGVYPSELEEYSKANNIEYAVDKTNFEDDADRNFIRLNVIPMIERRYRGAVRAVNEFSRECREARDMLENALDMRNIRYSDGAAIVNDSALRSDLAARYVRRALGYFSLTDVTRDMIARVVALADKRTGAVVELCNGAVAAREYGEVAVYVPRLPCSTEIPFGMGSNFLDGIAVDFRLDDTPPLKAPKGGAADADKLGGATLRFARDGDTFMPFGASARKGLNRYFIDEKVPARLRGRIPLVCRGNDVLVVVGMQISESVKQTAATVSKAVIARRGYDR